ncbi:hypothetical protein [Streptomyces sp. NPDC059597]|uniref:hypothetical protein n=1 Tax=Streptomyces sp. NPDC059597 TaxID=3346879 RepID=UPI0036994C68
MRAAAPVLVSPPPDHAAEADRPAGWTEAQEAHLLQLTVNALEESRKELRAETARLRAKLLTLGAALDGMGRLLATSSRDWGEYRVDAWLYAVILGWDCEQAEHDDTCTHDAMEEMAAAHGWDDAAVAKARRYRAAVREVTADPETPALLPESGRAAGLLDAAAFYDRLLTDMGSAVQCDPRYWQAIRRVATELRRLAAEAPQPDTEVDADTLARLLHAANVDANSDDFPTWDQLHPNGRAGYQIAADYLLARLHIAPSASAVSQPAPANDYEATTGHAITCLAVAGGTPDPHCPCQTATDGGEETRVDGTQQDGTQP